MFAVLQLSSVRAHVDGHTRFSQFESDGDDNARNVNYHIDDDNNGKVLINSNAKHVIPDKASTDEGALQYNNIQATTSLQTKMLQGQTHLHHQELRHLLSVGSAGDANESPVHSATGEMHNMGYHTHLRSTIRLIAKSKVNTPIKEDHPTVKMLVQHMAGDQGSYSHGHAKHSTLSAEDPLQNLSDQEIRDRFFSIATAAHDSMSLVEAATAIAASARGRAELTHQLRIGALQNRKMAARLVAALGKHLTQCNQDCQSVLSALMEMAESQEMDPQVQEIALVALLQPVCYDHAPALKAVQGIAESSTAGGVGTLGTLAMHVRHGLVAHMTRCSKATRGLSELAHIQESHTRFARELLLTATKSKDWERVMMCAVALTNSKLHQDVTSLPTMLRHAPQPVLDHVQNLLDQATNLPNDAPDADQAAADAAKAAADASTVEDADKATADDKAKWDPNNKKYEKVTKKGPKDAETKTKGQAALTWNSEVFKVISALKLPN